MGSKNISLREDVYRALSRAKADDESFSEAIDRLLAAREGRHPLYRLVGVLSEEAAEELRAESDRFRERVDAGMERSS